MDLIFQLFWFYGLKRLIEWNGTINLLTIILVIITMFYATQVKDQTKTVAEQAKIMYENQRIDIINKKHERYTKEMEQLVAPLYSWTCQEDLDAANLRICINELEILLKNKYLTSRTFRSKIEEYISSRGDWNIQPSSEATDTATALKDLKIATEKRYSELYDEIYKLQRELNIN
jgi:prenyltransferase beta subunit